jgi:hypothetical protein
MNEELSIGNTIKEARIKSGMSIVDVARLTRIPAHYVDAMEREQWNQLPSDTHRLGYLQRVVVTLKLPSEQILRRYREGPGNRRTRPRVAAAPTPDETVSRWAGANIQQTIAAVVIVLALCWTAYHHFVARSRDYAALANRMHPRHARLEIQQPSIFAQKIRIDSRQDSWIRVLNHHQLIYEGILPAGVTKEWSGAGPFRIKLSNIHSVSIFWNDQLVDTSPGARGSINNIVLPPPVSSDTVHAH